jgi:hypothetical protein
VRFLVIALAAALPTGSVAWSQEAARGAASSRAEESVTVLPTGRQVSRRGKSLPNIGRAQMGEVSDIERHMRLRDRRATTGICVGCRDEGDDF